MSFRIMLLAGSLLAGLTGVAPAAAQLDQNGVAVEVAAIEREPTPESKAQMQWWRKARFGMFIHWGLYAIPAGRWGDRTDQGEWIMHTSKIPVARYAQFATQFQPAAYHPEEWARIAKDAGMRYMVITAKHHDGFALWPSRASQWNVGDATPYKRDLLGPLVRAARDEGLKIGFYYSQAQDWYNPGGAKARFPEGTGWDEAQAGSFDTYLEKVAVPQIRELLDRYSVDMLWWDTPSDMTPKRSALIAAELARHPAVITNNRLGGGFLGNYETPENFVPVVPVSGDWETNMTMNGHWGYNAADRNFKSSTQIIRMLADIVGKGGNFLLNVAPDQNGVIPQESVDRLRDVGRWMRTNGEAIYDTERGPFDFSPYGAVTRKGNRLFVHVFEWPQNGRLVLPLRNRSARAHLLADPGRKLSVSSKNDGLVIAVPARAPDAVNSVVVVDLDAPPEPSPLVTDGARVSASSEAGAGSAAYNVLDGSNAKTWRAGTGNKEATLVIELAKSTRITGAGLGEPDVWPRLKQNFRIEAQVKGKWVPVAAGSTAGLGTKVSFTPLDARYLRVILQSDKGAPGLSELRFYPALQASTLRAPR